MTEEFKQKIDDLRVEGWSVESEHEERAVMVKRSFGRMGAHALIALLTIWWTFGLGNLLYAAYVYFGKADKRVVRP